MVKYPISVRCDSYRGNDAKKRAKASEEARCASLMQSKINELLLEQTAPIKSYFWSEIADITGLPIDVVKRLGMSIDGGSGGFTAYRHDLTFEQAMAKSQSQK
jgi:hypothetical protein